MKTIVLAICLLCTALTANAQYTREDAPVPPPQQQPAPQQPAADQPSPFWSHISIGGAFNLQLGDVTLVGVSPLFNYRIMDAFEFGIGPIYQYFSFIDQYGSYSSSSYGGRIAASIFFPGRFSNFFVHGEYDILNVPFDYNLFTNVTRTTLEFPMAGIGIKRPLSDNSYYYLLVSYNFNTSELLPYYYNPVVEAGFDFGL